MTDPNPTSTPSSGTARESSTPQPRSRSPVWEAIKRLLRTRVTAGLITVLPIYLTLVVVRVVFQIMRDASQWLVYAVLRGDWMPYVPQAWRFEWKVWTEQELQSSRLQWAIAIFSVFLTIFLLYAIGLLAANVFGRRVLEALERILDRLPLVKTVYRASKQILQTFTGEQTTAFQRVALIPYPNDQVLSVAFITAYSVDQQTGQELCTCFLATTPNPTTGYVFILPRSMVIELDWSTEDAVKIIMSGGILMPEVIKYSKSNTRHPWPTPGLAPTVLPASTPPSKGH